jgi:hypothetical protein
MRPNPWRALFADLWTLQCELWRTRWLRGKLALAQLIQRTSRE